MKDRYSRMDDTEVSFDVLDRNPYLAAAMSWLPEVIMYVIVLGLCTFIMMLVTGCASTKQELITADGDSYSRTGRALFSKQDTEGHANLVAYPNGSGLEFTIGDQGTQDATAMVSVIQAAVEAAVKGLLSGAPITGLPAQPGTGSPSPGAGPLSSLNARLSAVEELLSRLEALRDAVTPDE